MADSPFHPDRGQRADPPLEPGPGARPTSFPGRPSAPAPDDEGPIRAPGRARIHEANLASKKGNFILSFGFPGSGKTTLHSFLLRYLMEGGPYKTEPLRPGQAEEIDNDANRMITEWSREWRQGRFPESTPIGENEIRELSFEVQPMRGVRTPLEFSILEMSGEMMRTVIPSKQQNPHLSRVLHDLASNRSLNLVILLLVNPGVHENDILFTNFMRYLDANLLGEDIRQRAKLGIVISDPDKALAYLKEHRPEFAHHSELRGELVEEFVAAFAKQTYRIYLEWPNPKARMMTRFYIGEVEERDGVPRLVSPDYQSAAKLFDWIYLMFTGRKPGPTRWQKLWSWIRA